MLIMLMDYLEKEIYVIVMNDSIIVSACFQTLTSTNLSMTF